MRISARRHIFMQMNKLLAPALQYTPWIQVLLFMLRRVITNRLKAGELILEVPIIISIQSAFLFHCHCKNSGRHIPPHLLLHL